MVVFLSFLSKKVISGPFVINLLSKFSVFQSIQIKMSSSSSSNIKLIGTHDGTFHCDEVLAVSMLKMLPEYANAQVVRTRDEDKLKTCDIVVDVGGVYDPATLRFDHHQKSFDQSLSTLRPGSKHTTRLSSAGLVYHHFGEAVIAKILEKQKTDEVVIQLFEKIYENFIEEVDAVDNGIPVASGPLNYRITSTISQRVGRLNSSWRDRDPDTDAGFQKALQLVGPEFLERVHHYATDWWEAYSLVATAVDDRFQVDRSGEIVEFKDGGMPWKEHLEDLEISIDVPIKFVIYPDQSGKWRVQAVPISPGSFISRIPLSKEWQGVRDKELQEISGIPTAIFVHANGFIGGAAERDDAVRMARISIAKNRKD